MQEFTDDQPSVPASVSYRQLAAWLAEAGSEPAAVSRGAESRATPQQERFEALLVRWSRESRELLAALREPEPAVSQGRSPQQMMALGAVKAHLSMALQALASSGGRRD